MKALLCNSRNLRRKVPVTENLLTAGLVPFAIGSETAGSITYPAARCGVTAFRPTFGTVGRTGVLSLSESLVETEFFALFVYSYHW